MNDYPRYRTNLPCVKYDNVPQKSENFDFWNIIIL
jgi:hypothetical protein